MDARTDVHTDRQDKNIYASSLLGRGIINHVFIPCFIQILCLFLIYQAVQSTAASTLPDQSGNDTVTAG